jgi:hypothetical protein
MSLEQSAWMSDSPGKKYRDYILILPEQDVIVSFSSMQDEADTRAVWGCWICEEADSIVYTARTNAQVWRRESYELHGDQLTWINTVGISTWNRISETDISGNLRNRGVKVLEELGRRIPPDYPTAQSGPRY